MNWFGGSTKKRSQQQRSKSHQAKKQVPQQTFILEPLITPSGLVDSVDHTPHPLDVDLHTTELPDVHLPEIDVTHIPDTTHPVIEAVEIHPLTEIGSEPHSLTNLPQAPEDYSVETNPDVFDLSDYPVETEHSLNESSTEHQLDLETPESQAVETHTDVSSTGDYSVLADHTVEVPIGDHELDPLPFLHATSASIEHSGDTEVAATLATQLDSTFTSGVFTVGVKGEVSFDYLFDGGAYEGQVAIFNLNGMEHFVPGSEEFMHEAASRALSNSNLGHIVMSDATEGARFSGALPWEGGFNSGEYQGVTTFSMNPGDKFGIMLVPNGTVQQVWDGENCGDVHPLFSMTTANPNEAFHVGQIADVNGHGNTFVMEDLRMDGHSDKDYNDIIFQVRGATGQAVHLDDVMNPDLDWRMTELGGKLMEYIKPPANQPLVGFIDTGLSAENLDIDPFHVHFGPHSDYVANDGNPLLQPGEGSEHGTHVTGIVAATSGNSIGIDGVNDQAPIYVARATGSGQWVQALTDFVDAAKESGQPNAIANLSLDLTQVNPDESVTTRYEFTPQERGALEYARQNNVLVVVSAGNDGGVMSALGQASQEFDNIITVGAAKPIDLSTPVDNSFNKISVGETPTLDIPDISTDINTIDTDSLPINDYPDSLIPVEQAFDRADYSSYGYGLDLVASGGTIDNPVLSTVGDGVGTMAGTSVATAQVTGAASQVWAANPGLSYRQVIEILKSTATDLKTPGWDMETGAGLLNMAAAVTLAQETVPEPYATPPIAIPTTWKGEGKVTPMERATNFKGTVQNKIAVQINGGVNIRSGSSTSSSLVGKIPANTELEFDSQTQGELVNDPNGEGSSSTWYHLADGRGWISAVYVGNIQQISNPTNPTQPQQGFDINKILAVVLPNIRSYAQNSIPLILAQAQADGVTDLGQIAYILATAELESNLGRWMEELDSGAAYEGRAALGNTQPGDGVRFKGRGYVQITGRSNYTKWSQRLGIDLVGQPTKAAEAAIAAKILVQGMRDGTFTGKKLGDYINGSNRDFYNARRIVNQLDKAGLIAQRAQVYLNALNGAVIANQQPAPATRREYIVRSGDTLSGIAQREMGNANRWREIQRADGTTFTEDEARRLQIGQKVYLPVNYQAGTGTPVASPNPGNGGNPTPQPAPNPGSTDFPGRVMYTGVNIRSGPGVNYAKLGAYPPGTPLVFDAWTRGTAHEDAMIHQMDDRWFRVKGTNTWVASAYINGNPKANSRYIDPPSGGSNNGGGGQNSSPGNLLSLSRDQQRARLGIKPSSQNYKGSGNKFAASNGTGGTYLWCTDYAFGRALEKGLIQQYTGIGGAIRSHAGSWDDNVITGGYANKVGSQPRANSFIIFDADTGGTSDSRGHVAFVEEVYSDGSFLISESNWGTAMAFGLRHLPAGTRGKFIYLP